MEAMLDSNGMKISVQIQGNSSMTSSHSNHGNVNGREDEAISPGSSPRSPKKVSWVPGTVDNEGLPKKSFEKEFYFSQDIWG